VAVQFPAALVRMTGVCYLPLRFNQRCF